MKVTVEILERVADLTKVIVPEAEKEALEKSREQSGFKGKYCGENLSHAVNNLLKQKNKIHFEIAPPVETISLDETTVENLINYISLSVANAIIEKKENKNYLVYSKLRGLIDELEKRSVDTQTQGGIVDSHLKSGQKMHIVPENQESIYELLQQLLNSFDHPDYQQLQIGNNTIPAKDFFRSWREENRFYGPHVESFPGRIELAFQQALAPIYNSYVNKTSPKAETDWGYAAYKAQVNGLITSFKAERSFKRMSKTDKQAFETWVQSKNIWFGFVDMILAGHLNRPGGYETYMEKVLIKRIRKIDPRFKASTEDSPEKYGKI